MSNNKPPIHVSCAIIEHLGRVLVAQRMPGGSHGGLWEFPGGKIEAGETPCQCLRREILEELSIPITIKDTLSPISHVYPDKTIVLHPFVCQYPGIPVSLNSHQQICWELPQRLYLLNWSQADVKVWQYYVKNYLPRFSSGEAI